MEECFVCKHEVTFKLVYMQDGSALPDGRALIMPCCGTLTHSTCIRRLIRRKNTYESKCKRCKSKVLYKGTFFACGMFDPARQKRNEIRSLKDISANDKLPFLNIEKVFGNSFV